MVENNPAGQSPRGVITRLTISKIHDKLLIETNCEKVVMDSKTMLDDFHETIENRYLRNQYLNFLDVQNKRHPNKQLHALLLLAELDPATEKVIANAEHDRTWLSFDLEKVANKITHQQIVELVTCGIVCTDEGFSINS